MKQIPIIITSMLRNKYKLSKNNGLLPKIDSKSSQTNLKTCALLNKCSQKQYELHIHPSDPKKLIMFNQSQYLQRQCTSVIVDNSPKQTIQSISKIYPSSRPTLGMFIANQPSQSDILIQGIDSNLSILSLAFKNLKQTKNYNEDIFLSIIGVQNENILTDELYFQNLQNNQELLVKKEPIKQILNFKSKIKVSRQRDSHIYHAQNLSRHLIKSEDSLCQLLKKYKQIKTHLQHWISQKQQRQYYLMGEIYQIGLAEYDKNKEQIIRINKVHYIFKINQYIRTTSPLLLKLGMNLKRVAQKNYRLLNIHDSKVFKLLSECFSLQQNKSSLLFNHYLFLQVGEYYNFKQEYLCLVPVSEFMVDKLYQEQQNLNEISFFYTKHYMQNPNILNLIVQIENNLSQKQKEQIANILQNHEQMIYPSKIRLKTKSYNCDTVSSIEKKVIRNHLLTQQSQLLHYPQLQLDQIVHQTSKLFRLPSINKISLAQSKKSSNRMRILSRNQQFFNLKLLHQQYITSSSPLSRLNQSPTNKIAQQYNQVQSAFLHQQQIMEKESINKQGKFYKESKDWLNHVYGKNTSKNRKIKYFYKSIDKDKQNYLQSQAKTIIINVQKPKQQQKNSKIFIPQEKQNCPQQII